MVSLQKDIIISIILFTVGVGFIVIFAIWLLYKIWTNWCTIGYGDYSTVLPTILVLFGGFVAVVWVSQASALLLTKTTNVPVKIKKTEAVGLDLSGKYLMKVIGPKGPRTPHDHSGFDTWEQWCDVDGSNCVAIKKQRLCISNC